jgi:alkylation response protein AidB-like acyl-CoA dehydrogenase
MIEWSEQHLQIREMVRRFVEQEIVPRHEALEFGDEPPYSVLRKMVKTFGLDEMAKARFAAGIAREKAGAQEDKKVRRPSPEAGDAMAMQMIPIIELSRWSPGMVTALGVSMGLTAGAILSRGTVVQKEKWALPLLTRD